MPDRGKLSSVVELSPLAHVPGRFSSRLVRPSTWDFMARGGCASLTLETSTVRRPFLALPQSRLDIEICVCVSRLTRFDYHVRLLKPRALAQLLLLWIRLPNLIICRIHPSCTSQMHQLPAPDKKPRDIEHVAMFCEVTTPAAALTAKRSLVSATSSLRPDWP